MNDGCLNELRLSSYDKSTCFPLVQDLFFYCCELQLLSGLKMIIPYLFF